MTKKEFNSIENMNSELICGDDLTYLKDRTLMYGYTCERHTFHVYFKNKEIHVVVYDSDYSGGIEKPKNMREISVQSNHDYIPDKRLYPDACDYQFCKLLKDRGMILPFTSFNDGRPVEDFYGFTLEDYRM